MVTILLAMRITCIPQTYNRRCDIIFAVILYQACMNWTLIQWIRKKSTHRRKMVYFGVKLAIIHDLGTFWCWVHLSRLMRFWEDQIVNELAVRGSKTICRTGQWTPCSFLYYMLQILCKCKNKKATRKQHRNKRTYMANCNNLYDN